MDKLIFTIDLDAFFASAEELRNPGINNQPLAVGYDFKGKGIVTSGNYLAREYGVKAGMPLFKAKELCPKIKIIQPDMEYYERLSNAVFETILTFTHKVEIVSVDECYVDVTDLLRRYEPLKIASIIKNKVFEETNLVVSIGISTDIALSKMASGMAKPNGICTLYRHEIEEKLWPLDISKLYFVGRMSVPKFNDNGIYTIGDLANIDLNSKEYSILRSLMGINLEVLINMANGYSRERVIYKPDLVKGMSKDNTLHYTITLYTDLIKEMNSVFETLYKRLTARKFMVSTIGVTFGKAELHKYKSKRKTIKATDKKDEIWPIVVELLDILYEDIKEIRKISISFSNLKPKEKTNKQKSIEESTEERKEKTLQDIIENASFETNSELVLASTMKDNKRYKRGKPLESDNIKFKAWE